MIPGTGSGAEGIIPPPTPMAASVDPAFLKASDLFENQPEEFLRAVLAQGRVLEFGPGAVVFRQGDQGDCLYIVKTGVLEILAAPADGSEPVPRRLPGHRRSDRRAGAAHRVAAHRDAALARAGRAVHPREGGLPGPHGDAAELLAEPLPRARPAPRGHDPEGPRASTKQLQGNLRFFDLATVIQTLIGSHQTGSLTIVPGGGQAERRRDLLLQGEHRPRQGQAAHRRRRRVPAFPITRRRGVLLHRPPRAGGRGPDRHHHARHLAAHGVGAAAGRAAAPRRAAIRERTHLPPEGDASSNGRTPRRSSSRSPVWSRLKRGASIGDLQHEVPRCSYAHLQDGRDASRHGADSIGILIIDPPPYASPRRGREPLLPTTRSALVAPTLALSSGAGAMQRLCTQATGCPNDGFTPA